ncbi:MAG: creatininase family protein [Hyphomicrobiales bacterium]
MAARKHALKDMTFVEFAERLSEKPVMLLPFGSQEEQGPHAPMGDYMVTERLSIMAAERSGAIAAPTVPFGNADYFRAIAGGIQLRAETFMMLVEDVVTAFLDHGVARLIIFNGHTSNGPLIEQVLRRIRRERGITVPTLQVWQILPPEMWKRIHAERASAARGHGADPLTSVYLHLFPELVRSDLAAAARPRRALGLEAAGVRSVTFEGVSVEVPLDVTDVTANGVIGGDPMISSAAAGAEITEWIVAFTARFIEHFRKCDPRDVHAPPHGV